MKATSKKFFQELNGILSFSFQCAGKWIVGVDYGEGPPVPISNTVVKLTGADNTWLETLRLNQGVPARSYLQRTGCELSSLDQTLNSLRSRKLMVTDNERLACTDQGHVFLNSILEEFL